MLNYCVAYIYKKGIELKSMELFSFFENLHFYDASWALVLGHNSTAYNFVFVFLPKKGSLNFEIKKITADQV